jgi:hypothetical protein
MITIFTLPKPFVGHIGMIQRNAIQSWTRLHPDVDILLFGNEPGTADVAAELGIRHFPDVEVNEYGTPLMSGYFRQAEEMARHSRMCYVNADIILFPDLLHAVAKIDLPRFVMGGRRTDYDIEKPIDFTRADWAEEVREDAEKNGSLHDFSGIDYFVYPRGMFGEIPRFALGRWYWDNWLVYRARRLGGALVDASACVMAIHQNHDYRHIVDLESKGESRNQGGIESFGNRLLVTSIMMTLEDADWQVNASGLSRIFRKTRWHLVNEAALRAEIHGVPAWIRRSLVWIARQQWDRNWKRRYAELLSERPELMVQGGARDPERLRDRIG